MKLATVSDALRQLKAEDLIISESKLRRDAQSGRLPSMIVGTRTLIDLDVARELAYRGDGITIEQLSEETGLKVCMIRRGIREGWIPSRKEGKAYRFDLAEVQAAIEQKMKKR